MAPIYTISSILIVICFATVQCQRFSSQEQQFQDYEDAPAEQPPQRRPVSRPSPALQNSILSDATVKTTTPVVAILKQINRHNEDGSYTYGFEGGDGSFKIETKLANGEVMGKYGYVDDTGKVRVIEYGANKYGFQPSGEGITVPPPNLVDETTNKNGESVDQFDELEEQRPQAPPARPPPRAPVRAPAPRPAPRPAQEQFASNSFESRPSFQQVVEEPESRAPVQFLPQEVQSRPPPPPQRPSPSFTQLLEDFPTLRGPSSFSASAPTPQRPASFAPEPQRPQFVPAPQRPQFAPAPSFGGPAPVPQRPQPFPGAAPAGPSFGPPPQRPQSFAGAAPVPSRPAAFPGAAPVPQRPQSFAPQEFEDPSQIQFRPRPAQGFFQPQQPERPVQRQGPSSSILDQLEKDFALPQGSRPLHDITFAG